jgi:hypothetical protein
MIRSVFWSFLFGYIMICAFVLAMPSTADAAKQGGNVFFWLMDGVGVPAILKNCSSSASCCRTISAPLPVSPRCRG